MENATFDLTFTPAELTLIAGMLNASSLVLPEDPFDDLPTEQIEGTLRQAQESLAARQYVRVQDDGSIVLDTAVAALVGALAFAESSLIVTCVIGDEEPPCTRRIHFASRLIVEQEQQRDGSHSLTAVQDRETVYQRLREFVHLADQPAPPLPACTLPEADVTEARLVVAVEGETACADLLEGAGAPAAVASSLAEALAHPISQITLLALAWEGESARRVGSFMLLEGVDGLWLFQPLQRDGESWVEVVPCDASSAIRQMEELTHPVIPVVQE